MAQINTEKILKSQAQKQDYKFEIQRDQTELRTQASTSDNTIQLD